MLASDVIERDGTIIEKATARYIPLKLVFSNVQQLKKSDFFTSLDQYPPDDPSRVIAYMYSWIQPDMEDIFHMFGLRGSAEADMNFFASSVTYEQGEVGTPFTFERDYSPSPPMPHREVPQPYDIHNRFGGDPVAFRLNGCTVENKLFIGGIEIQPDQRPEIDAVLNLGEQSSAWVKDDQLYINDRTVEKEKRPEGMARGRHPRRWQTGWSKDCKRMKAFWSTVWQDELLDHDHLRRTDIVGRDQRRGRLAPRS
ncbi:MAG: hypothetical protein U0V48_04325 [Anaerolineales bacterium]